jgi:hypothetical protein
MLATVETLDDQNGFCDRSAQNGDDGQQFFDWLLVWQQPKEYLRQCKLKISVLLVLDYYSASWQAIENATELELKAVNI